jgi:hypothetical protein
MGINYNTPAHKELRTYLISRYVPGVTLCWRCMQPITTLRTRDIHLGHDDDNPAIYRGLEHARCNTSAGASRGNKMGPPRGRARTRRASRIW